MVHVHTFTATVTLQWFVFCVCAFASVSGFRLPGNSDVAITGPDIAADGNSFSITCNCMDFMKSVYQFNPSFSGNFTVTFSANGRQVDSYSFSPQTGLVCGPKLRFGTGGRQDTALNSNFTCSLSTEVNQPGGAPMPVASTSDNFFLGFSVEQNPMVVKEGETTELVVNSNIPVLCKNIPDCCVTVNLKIDGNKNNLAAISTCNYDICTSDWSVIDRRAVLRIPLVANKDPSQDNEKDMKVVFDPLRPSGGQRVHQLLNNLKIPEVDVRLIHKYETTRVKILDEAFSVCTITGDPHIRPFEDHHWMIQLYQVGEFMMYKNLEQDVEIHGKTWPCNGHASCLCSLIARQGNDVIRVSICDDINLPPHIRRRNAWSRLSWVLQHARMELKVPDGHLPEGTRVLSDDEDKYLQLKFKSGMKVEVKHPYQAALYAKITVPPEHGRRQAGRGLCGTPGANFSRILTKGDGGLTVCRSTHRGMDCKNDEYNESWRLKKTNSMYWKAPADNKLLTRGQSLCGCAEGIQGSASTIKCDFSGNQETKIKDCQHCTDITNMLPPGLFSGSFTATKRGAPISRISNLRRTTPTRTTTTTRTTTPDPNGGLYTFDPHDYFARNWSQHSLPNQNNQARKSEDWARQHCQRSINRSVMISMCGNTFQPVHNSSINECIEDYMLTGHTEMMTASVHAYNMLCQWEVLKDPNNYVMGTDGVRELRDDVTAMTLCSQTCSNNGVCQSGVCVCKSGWSGNHCAIRGNNFNTTRQASPTATSTSTAAAATSAVTTVPTAAARTRMCDITNDNCSTIELPAPTDAAVGEAVSCKFQLSQDTLRITDGVVDKRGLCQCAMPALYIGRNIGAAFVHISAVCETSSHPPHEFIVYDSRCVDSNLTQNSSVCIIDLLCYEDGLINPANDYEGCAPGRNRSSWSQVPHRYLSPSEVELTLTGPDPRTIMMTCALPSPAPSALTVDWILNGRKIFSQNLAVGEDHVDKFLLDFTALVKGSPGRLMCQIEDRSATPPRVMVSKETSLI